MEEALRYNGLKALIVRKDEGMVCYAVPHRVILIMLKSSLSSSAWSLVRLAVNRLP